MQKNCQNHVIEFADKIKSPQYGMVMAMSPTRPDHCQHWPKCLQCAQERIRRGRQATLS